MDLQVRWNGNAYTIVDMDIEESGGKAIVRDNMWESGWARVDEDFAGNGDAYVLHLHRNAVIEYVQSGLTPYDSDCGSEGDRPAVLGRRVSAEGAERYFTINVHLGKGADGARRTYALKRLAAEAGHYWNGEPSIGRWLSALADERIGADWRPRTAPPLKTKLKALARDQIQLWQQLVVELS